MLNESIDLCSTQFDTNAAGMKLASSMPDSNLSWGNTDVKLDIANLDCVQDVLQLCQQTPDNVQHEKLTITDTAAHKGRDNETGVFSRKKSSYQVFETFFAWKENGVADSSRILSRECYNAWVISRCPPPRKPEEGFRSAIIGHLAATGRRQPFPPDIEADLLRLISKKQVWQCFRGTKVTIGLYGSKTKGYHETRLKNKSKLSNNSQTTTEENVTMKRISNNENLLKLKTKRKQISVFWEKENVIKRARQADQLLLNLCCDAHNRFMDKNMPSEFKAQEHYDNNICNLYEPRRDYGGEVENPDDIVDPHYANPSVPLLSDQIDTFVIHEVLQQLNFFARCHSNTGPGIFSRTILEFYGTNLGAHLRRLYEHGIDIPSAPLYHMLNLNPDNDERLNRSFLLPRDKSDFYKNRPIGTFVLDGTMTILESYNAVPIFGETGVLRPLQTFTASQTEAAVHMIQALPILKERGWFWYHKIILTKESGRKVILGRCQRTETGFLIQFQEVSDMFQNLLEKPMIFV